MPLRGRPIFLHYNAWNIRENQYQPNDAANHTLVWVKDNTPVPITTTPVEITYNGTHCCYGISLSETDTACWVGTLVGTSSTQNVVILKQTVIFEQILGTGAVLIDHNYGGTDNLRYLAPNGLGIDNATILAYFKSDYDAGKRGRGYLVAETRTNAEGRWVRPMVLDPGEYAIVFFKQGAYSPSVKYITVEEP